MPVEDQQEIARLVQDLVKEDLARVAYKHEAVVAFTESKVAKVYWASTTQEQQLADYSVEAEYAWARRYAVLAARKERIPVSPQHKGFSCLITRRLPDRTLFATRLIDVGSTHAEVVALYRAIADLAKTYERCRTSSKVLLADLCNNLDIQLSDLTTDLDLELSESIRSGVEAARPSLAAALEESVRGGWVRWCHGALFTPNVFLLDNRQFVTIDPVVGKPRASRMDVIGDLGAPYADLLMLAKPELSSMFRRLVLAAAASQAQRILFFAYALAKSCVRLRFVAKERNSCGASVREHRLIDAHAPRAIRTLLTDLREAVLETAPLGVV